MDFDGSLLVSGVRTNRRPSRGLWFVAGALAVLALVAAIGAGARP